MSTMIEDKLYSVAEVAKKTGLTEGRIRQLCRWESLGKKYGRDWMLRDSDLEKIGNFPRRWKNHRKTA